MERRALYSLILLGLFAIIIFVGVILSALSSEDIDTICSENNKTLFRLNDEWVCFDFPTGSGNDSFIGNYSVFLTHINNSVLNNGSYFNQNWLLISNWNATNTSYALLSQINNGSYINQDWLLTSNWNATNNSYYLNSNLLNFINGTYGNATWLKISNWNATNTSYLEIKNWNATNISYYLASNPFGFFNITSNIGNWTADKGLYTLLTTLNNGSYFNLNWLLNSGDIATGNYTFDISTFFIDSTNDRVGIGTATPQNTLNVVGDINATTNIYGRSLGLETSEIINGSEPLLRLWESDNANEDWQLINSAGDLLLQEQYNNGTNVTRFGIQGTTGRVGINMDPSLTSAVLGIQGKNGQVSLKIFNTATTNVVRAYPDSSGNGAIDLLDTTPTVKLLLSANGNSYFNGGNVGINTTSPNQNLHVVGNLNVTRNIYVGGCIQYNYNTTLGVCI